MEPTPVNAYKVTIEIEITLRNNPFTDYAYLRTIAEIMKVAEQMLEGNHLGDSAQTVILSEERVANSWYGVRLLPVEIVTNPEDTPDQD